MKIFFLSRATKYENKMKNDNKYITIIWMRVDDNLFNYLNVGLLFAQKKILNEQLQYGLHIN